MIKYCRGCILPETKPHLGLDENGICSACRFMKERKEVDWKEREERLKTILDRYRSKDGHRYDCIIPVSGGKDSTYQTVKMLEFGMNPLCVTGTTCDLSDIGRKNIENIQRLGVDYIEFTTNRQIRKKLNKFCLEQVGDISWPEHVSIFTIPIQVAVNYKVPLIIWGENSQTEYGGPAEAGRKNTLDRKWLEEFGGLLGLRITDLIGVEDIERKHLIPWIYPSDQELQEVGVTGIFLGYYIPWDGFQNSQIAQKSGFTPYHKNVEGSAVDYENLDNYQTGIHDYFKFLKFGFGRASDILSLQIRHGRITRDEAIKRAKDWDGKFPWEYLGKGLDDILSDIGMTVDEFMHVCDRFTNKKLFKLDEKGCLSKDDKGNLTKINYDNVDELIARA
jgi:N-acetyl sugar amidotransferase